MAEELKKHGLFVDDGYILRVNEPSLTKDTEDLKDENEVFLDSNYFQFKIIKKLMKNFFRARRFQKSHW